MIHSLLIGNELDILRYSKILEQSKYFGTIDKLVYNTPDLPNIELTNKTIDALFLLSEFNNTFPLFEQVLKLNIKFYFIDQPSLEKEQLQYLNKLYQESGVLMHPETNELAHPLLDEFLSTKKHYLLFRYTKSIAHKKYARESIYSALSFLSLLSPMQVKKIDINSFETSETGRPLIKIRLKMYEGSIAFIILKLENKNDCSILMESHEGSFTFNLSENYLENIHGIQFKGEEANLDDLVKRNIDQFGLNIILNNKHKFTFNHYCLTIKTLTKIMVMLDDHF